MNSCGPGRALRSARRRALDHHIFFGNLHIRAQFSVLPADNLRENRSGVAVLKSRILLSLLLTALFIAPAVAEVQFADLTINDDNRTLFTAEVDAPEFRSYRTAFTATIDSESADIEITQLTHYPERVAYLPSSGQLQIHNRFGLFRTDGNLENIQPLEGFDSFVGGQDILTGKISPVDISPDGRYMIAFDPQSPAYGNLVLTRFSDSSKTVISRNVELSLDSLPVAWSPESDFFIYAKSGDLFYFSVDQFESGRLLSEDFRNIGSGQMSNVRWGSENELYYISGTLVYQILGVEFFTRSLYQEFLRIGRIVGKIPFRFDPNFDHFWISPDGTQVLLDKGGRNIYLYFLQTNESADTASTIQLPYLYLPRNAAVEEVIWTSEGVVTLLVGGVFEGQRSSTMYQLDLSGSGDDYSFERLDNSSVRSMVLSPDEGSIALLGSDGVEFYDLDTWSKSGELSHNNPHHLLYVNSREVIVAGSDLIELVDLDDDSRRFIAFSRAESLGFSSSNGEILVSTAGETQEFDNKTGRWFSRDSFSATDVAVATDQYRVYLQELSSGSYQNMIMIRRIQRSSDALGTISMFDPPVKSYEPFPSQDEEVSFTTFRHGSRIRRREVALVFNAVDSAEGLTEILATLEDYGIRATFFVNGDFIRRYPGATREISQSIHEVGSLFNIYFNMSDSRFQVTRDFIRQGLAANEDEYFESTGEELTLLWHAPYYYVSPEIVAATENMNYTYIGRDVDSLDWVPTRDDNGISRLYYPSAQLIERIIDLKRPGSIISMTVGTPANDRQDGGREDYLFKNLDILINYLLELGYDIVPVTTLMDNAR
jgi:peptidoglycan/xylan/chitin deacetylase (PgdA/CDA1 family)